jgi:hypothetical protein
LNIEECRLNNVTGFPPEADQVSDVSRFIKMTDTRFKVTAKPFLQVSVFGTVTF